jgi:thioredoxin-dependent peroxiredoxin
MKRKFAGRMLGVSLGAALAVYALVAYATLKPGDHAPVFTSQASLGGNVYEYSLADELKKGPVVLYFYPALVITHKYVWFC